MAQQKPWNCQNPFPIKSKMAEGAQIVNYCYPLISVKTRAKDFKIGAHIYYEEGFGKNAKLRQRGISGVTRKFFRGEQIQGVWGQKSPSGVQGRSPGGGLGAKLPDADDFTMKK